MLCGTAFYMYVILCTQNVFKLVLQATTNGCCVELSSICISFSVHRMYLNWCYRQLPMDAVWNCLLYVCHSLYTECILIGVTGNYQWMLCGTAFYMYVILCTQNVFKLVLQATTNWCSVELPSICMSFSVHRMYFNWCYRQLPMDAVWNCLLYVYHSLYTECI